MKAQDYDNVYKILKAYNGDNNLIRYYQYMNNENKLIVNDFIAKYVLSNKDYKSVFINGIIKISSDLGSILKSKYELDFEPKVLYITRIIGELGNTYHCYAQYRKSVDPQLMYLNKKYILTPLFVEDYENMDIDFDKYDKMTEKYNRKIKDHQKTAVKFMLTRKKCILADSMGLGKTLSAIIAALEGGFKKILIITTASLKSTWKRELMYYVPKEDVNIVTSKKWSGNEKFTIINYDIAQKFYEVPMETVYQENETLDSNGNVITYKTPVMVKSKSTGKMVEKKVKSRKKSIIEECIKNSPLFLEGYDCVIIDEAQKLSNSTSIRYKVIDDFIKRTGIKNVFLVTGTPLTNRPYNLYNILKLINADVVSDYEYYVKRYCGGKQIRMKTGATILTRDGATHLNELREKIKPLYIRRLQSDIPGMVNKTVITRQYPLNDKQKEKYDELWNKYVDEKEKNFIQSFKNNNDVNSLILNINSYRQLVENSLVRKFLATEMVKNTIEEVDEYIEYGEKAIIFCTYHDEMELFKKHYGKKCVVYDGRMSVKQKDTAEYEFMNNPKVTVFIGQIIAASVGLTLTISNRLWFNSYSWVAADNLQAQDRIYRITQKNDVCCQYQLFEDSISQDMFDKVMTKELIMNETIKSEKDK